jgi:hypothetical protein
VTKHVPDLLKVHTPVMTFIYDYEVENYKKRPRSRLLPEASSSVRGIDNCFGTLDSPKGYRSATRGGEYDVVNDSDNNNVDGLEEPIPEMDVYIQLSSSSKVGHIRLVGGEAVCRSSNGTHLQPPSHVSHSPWLWSEHTKLHARELQRYHEHSSNHLERALLAENGLTFIVSKHQRLMMSKIEFKKLQDLKIKKDLNELFIKNSVIRHLSFKLSEPLGMELEYDEELNHVAVFEVFQGGQGRRLGVFPTSVIVSVKGEHKLIALENNPHHHFHHKHNHHHHPHHEPGFENSEEYKPPVILHHDMKLHAGVGAFNEDVAQQLNEKDRHQHHLQHQHELHVQQEHAKNVPTEFEVHTLTHFQNAVNIIKEVYSNIVVTFLVPLEEIKKEKERELQELLKKEKEREEHELLLNTIDTYDEESPMKENRAATQFDFSKFSNKHHGQLSHNEQQFEDASSPPMGTMSHILKKIAEITEDTESRVIKSRERKVGEGISVEQQVTNKLDLEDSARIRPSSRNGRSRRVLQADGKGGDGEEPSKKVPSLWTFTTGEGSEIIEGIKVLGDARVMKIELEKTTMAIKDDDGPLFKDHSDLYASKTHDNLAVPPNNNNNNSNLPSMPNRSKSFNFESIIASEEMEEEIMKNDDEALLATRKKFEVRPMFGNDIDEEGEEGEESGGGGERDMLLARIPGSSKKNKNKNGSPRSPTSPTSPNTRDDNSSINSNQSGNSQSGNETTSFPSSPKNIHHHHHQPLPTLQNRRASNRSSILSNASSNQKQRRDSFKANQLIRHTLRSNLPLDLGVSKHDEVPVNIFIINNSHFHVEVGWINYHGSVVVRRVLPPQLSHFEVSYATHPWIITTMNPIPHPTKPPDSMEHEYVFTSTHVSSALIFFIFFIFHFSFFIFFLNMEHTNLKIKTKQTNTAAISSLQRMMTQ